MQLWQQLDEERILAFGWLLIFEKDWDGAEWSEVAKYDLAECQNPAQFDGVKQG